MFWGLLCFIHFFLLIDYPSTLSAMCLKFAVMLGIAMHPSMFSKNVSENIQRDMSGVSVVSPTPQKKKSPLKECKDMPIVFC